MYESKGGVGEGGEMTGVLLEKEGGWGVKDRGGIDVLAVCLEGHGRRQGSWVHQCTGNVQEVEDPAPPRKVSSCPFSSVLFHPVLSCPCSTSHCPLSPTSLHPVLSLPVSYYPVPSRFTTTIYPPSRVPSHAARNVRDGRLRS